MTERAREQQKAREFFQREYGVDPEQSVFDVMYRYAHERVLDELREACKVMCKFCERDCALDEAGGHVHLCCAREGLHYIADCTASPIRRRIATLEAEG